MLLAMYPHLSNGRRMIGSDHLRTEPETAVEEYLDMFGNRCARLEMPAGATKLWSDCIVEDSGQPDEFNWDARQHEIVDLPVATLAYLTASRYCESDELVEMAWDLFGATPSGWARVQAISNWVHNHVIFGYRFGRPTKTGSLLVVDAPWFGYAVTVLWILTSHHERMQLHGQHERALCRTRGS